jgi:hypothetical protein
MYDKYNKQQDDGFVSGWNEGDLKNLRLHQIQTAINYYKTNPLVKDEFGVYGYENWFKQIECLCDEGKSKYSSLEKEEIEKLVNLIELSFEFKPIFKVVYDVSYKTRRIETINRENWKDNLKLLRMFEDKVKYFNDLHGFSTRNIDTEEEGL